MPEIMNETNEFDKAFRAAARLSDNGSADASAPEAMQNGLSMADARMVAEDRARAEAAAANDDMNAGADEEAAEEAEAEAYRDMFAREKQRLKSFKGRYRKEREAWKEERRMLMERLAALEATVEGASKEPRAAAAGSMSQAPIDGPSAEARLLEMVRREVMTIIAPLFESAETELHRNRIATAHPDFEQVAADPDLLDWIDDQPDYLADTMRDVLDRGTADQVVDLLSRFKQDRRDKRSADKAADKQRTDKLAKRAEAVSAGKSTGPRKRAAKEDFEGAWAEAAARAAR